MFDTRCVVDSEMLHNLIGGMPQFITSCTCIEYAIAQPNMPFGLAAVRTHSDERKQTVVSDIAILLHYTSGCTRG